MRIKQNIQFNKIVKDLQYNLMERLNNEMLLRTNKLGNSKKIIYPYSNQNDSDLNSSFFNLKNLGSSKKDFTQIQLQ